MRPLTRALYNSARALQLGSTILHTCAAATLSLAELRDDIRARWQTFNDQPEDVLDGLHPWEQHLADRLAQPGASVLIVGCGSGREMLAYLQRGCRVTGIDPAGRALDVARTLVAQHHFSADLIEGFVDDVDVSGRYDVILFGWWAYGQIPEASRRSRTLRRLSAQLNDGGRIAVAYDLRLRPRRIVVAAARMAGTIAGSDWRVEAGDILEWRLFSGGKPFFGYDHAFRPEEIEREAAAAGLRVTYRRDPPDAPVYILEPAAR